MIIHILHSFYFLLDTLGTLFKSLYVKGDEFQLVEDVVNLTTTITEQRNCGELRSGLYSMLSDCSEFMKEKMEPYFPRILKLMTVSFNEIDTTVRKSAIIFDHSRLRMNIFSTFIGR